MRVLLISANTERLNMPTMPLGLGYVAAATRAAGHEVEFLDLMHQEEPLAAVVSAIERSAPEAIGLSIRNVDDQELLAPRFLLEKAKEVVAACRAASAAPIVLGGAGYSLFPDAALVELGADLGVSGDGELAFPALLERLARGADPGDLPGVHVAGRPAVAAQEAPALARLPQPHEAWARVDPATPELWVPVQSRRGCPNGCAYCSTALIQGRAIRLRPVEEVVEQVERLSRAGFGRLYFVDNVFNQPEAYALELCQGLRRLGRPLSFRVILYPHRISQELIDELAAAGCAEVALGFESGSEPVLRALNKRFSPAEVADVSARLAAKGIRRTGFLLLGGPEETRATVEESLAFARSLRLELVRVTVGLRVYPGTALARLALAEGQIAAGDDLLRPRFYLAPGLAPWIHERISSGMLPGQALR